MTVAECDARVERLRIDLDQAIGIAQKASPKTDVDADWDDAEDLCNDLWLAIRNLREARKAEGLP